MAGFNPIDLASPNDREGDDLREGGEKINTMFEELFASQGGQVVIIDY